MSEHTMREAHASTLRDSQYILVLAYNGNPFHVPQTEAHFERLRRIAATLDAVERNVALASSPALPDVEPVAWISQRSLELLARGESALVGPSQAGPHGGNTALIAKPPRPLEEALAAAPQAPAADAPVSPAVCKAMIRFWQKRLHVLQGDAAPPAAQEKP